MKMMFPGASALLLLLLAEPSIATPDDQPGHVSPAPGTSSNSAR